MSFINYSLKEINCKIIYYGPSLSGKTSNLVYISKFSAPNTAGKLISIDNENSGSFFFDFLPIDLGSINGYKTKFHLYTVASNFKFEASSKLIFKGADGIVFVADSQKNRLEENIDSLKNLKNVLFEFGYEYQNFPLVLQYNKRDLSSILSVEELSSVLNDRVVKEIEATASNGYGVFDTLKSISKSVLDELKSA